MITHCRNGDIAYDRPKVMGILNLTPDSFSDGGRSFEDSLKWAYGMIDAGADIIDIGGESTRPGSLPVDELEEIMRIMPMIRRLSQTTDVIISVDTCKTHVAEMALDAGADIINDINGLRAPGMLELATNRQVPVMIMHMHGTPKTMQDDPLDIEDRRMIIDFLAERKKAAEDAGIKDIILDPGIGFGKTAELNMDIAEHSSDFSLGCPVLIGASRKRFLKNYYPDLDRDDATVEVNRKALKSGANILRVHNVEKTVELIRGSV